MTEVPVTITCQGTDMIGILHVPKNPPNVALIVVVGGPQYRVGSHRQFILLGRSLASRGVAVLRFDCRGMGDSDGGFQGFERIGPDIAATVDFMSQRFDSVRHMVLWGLCDATSAICECAAGDARISGLVLLNPWVRTDSGQARAELRHYYLKRVFEREFLRKILRLEFDIRGSFRAFLSNIRRALRLSRGTPGPKPSQPEVDLVEHMGGHLRQYRGRILLIMSGRDLTAREFDTSTRRSATWRSILKRPGLTRRDLADADHTFSKRVWGDQVMEWTSEWLRPFR